MAKVAAGLAAGCTMVLKPSEMAPLNAQALAEACIEIGLPPGVFNIVHGTVPGSPAWVSKASRNRVSLPRYGMRWEYEGRNAIQADWRLEHVSTGGMS